MAAPRLPLRPIVVASTVVTAGVLPAFLTGAVAVEMGGELGLTLSSLGALVGVHFGAAALTVALAGHMVEHLGAKRGIRLGAALALLSAAGIALVAGSDLSVGLFLALGGVANGIAQTSANLYLVRSIPSRWQGLAFGIKQSAIPLATSLAGLSVPLLALTFGWRYAFGMAALLAATVMVIRVDTSPVAEPGRPGDRDGDSSTMPAGTATLALLGVVAFLGVWGGQAMGAFLVSSTVAGGISQGVAGVLLTVGSFSAVVVRVVVGWHVDRSRLPGLRLIGWMLLVGAAGLAAIAGQAPILLWVGPLLAFAGGWGWPGLFVHAVVRMRPADPARATGITQTGVFAGATLGPPAFGALVEATSYPVGWIATAVAAALAGGMVLAMDRRIGPKTALHRGANG